MNPKQISELPSSHECIAAWTEQRYLIPGLSGDEYPVVRRIDDDGCLRVERVGGVLERVLPGLNMIVTSKNGQAMPCAVGTKDHHATPPEEKRKKIDTSDYSMDLTNSSQVGVVVDQIKARWGRIDILVVNAGIYDHTAAEDIEDDEWLRVMDTNLNGAFCCVRRSAIPGL